MPDGDVIDSLSLEIGASVNKSIDAIDQLQSKLAKLNGALGNYLDDGKYVGAIRNLTSGFTELDNSISDDVVSKVASLAKSLNTLSSSADKVGKSFSTVTKYPETLNEHVSKNLGDLFTQFGIKGEENIKRVTNGFIELENVAASGGSTNNAMDGLISDIQELSNVAIEGTRVYEGLVDAVNEYLRTTDRIHIERGSGSEYRDGDLLGHLGAIAGRNAKKFTTKPGGVDFQEFAREINDQFHLIPEHFNEEGDSWFKIDEFADVMRRARAEMNGFAEDSKKVKPAADEVFVAISEQTEAVRQAMSSFQDTGVETTLSPIERIIPELQNLSGVTIPDFTNLATLAKSVGTLGNDKSTVASDNIPKIVQGLQPLSAGFTIPDFTSLATMASAVAKLGNDASTTATTNIPVLANGLKTLDGVKIPDFSNLGVLANATSKLGNANSQNAAWVLPNIMSELESFSQHFSGLTIDAGALNTIQQLGSAFSKLGGKNANEAIKTLPQLSDAIRQMVEDLNTLPEVSDKTQQLVVALGNLAKANGKAQTAATGTNSAYGMLSKTMKGLSGWVFKNWKNTNLLKSAITALGSGVKNYNQSMNSAKAHTESLTGAIIKVRSIIWGLKRVMGFFSEAVGNASSLTEVMNVVENVYDASYIEEFNKATQNTIETLGMSELTFKQFASRYQAMGRAMGITNSQMQGAEDHLKSMGIEYGVTTGKMGDMSVNLTRLAADMASFYDVAQEDVYTSLQAIYTGQTRPLMLAA